jgi:hypothetical protein
VEIAWENPHASTWKTGLAVDQVEDLQLDDVRIAAAPGSDKPVLQLNDADGVLIRQSRIASINVTGSKSKAVRLFETEAKLTAGPEAAPVIVK